MSSASPMSQCGAEACHTVLLGRAKKGGGGGGGEADRPASRTVTFAYTPPIGTSGSAGFGMRRGSSSRSSSISASAASSCLIFSPASVDVRLSSATSGPSATAPAWIAAPICFEASLRVALSASVSASSRRRSASSSSARSTSAGSSPLSTRALANDVGLLAEPWKADAHAVAPSIAASRRRVATKSGSSDASSQPARGPLVRPRNAR